MTICFKDMVAIMVCDDFLSAEDFRAYMLTIYANEWLGRIEFGEAKLQRHDLKTSTCFNLA